ncbi:MAG: sodium:proton antiporter, partial [Firmicutes bacterium HGW-Firmicutes-6]
MFETVDVGILSIIPPIIAIVLALITKEVISALLIGILSGTLIYVVSSGGGGLVEMGTVAFGLIADTVG